VVGAFEQVRVDAERDARGRVPELAGDKDDVQALGDQERGEAVPERVQRESPGRLQPRPLDRIAEAVTDVPVVESAAAGGREDEVVRRFVDRREATFTQQLRPAPGRGRRPALPLLS
jgi:hypothetical protein